MSLNSSLVKQDSNNLFHSSVMTLSSLGTPSTHGSFISRLPAFDALQRGFIVCFHAFSNLFRDSFLAYLIVFNADFMFFSIFLVWRQSFSLLKDAFWLQLNSFTLLFSLFSFSGISDRCHAIALSPYYSVFEALHATCKYFTLLTASHHFTHFFPLLLQRFTVEN